MRLDRLNVADLLGLVSFFTAAQVKAGLEILALALCILATAPLALLRWRMIVRGQSSTAKEIGKDEGNH